MHYCSDALSVLLEHYVKTDLKIDLLCSLDPQECVVFNHSNGILKIMQLQKGEKNICKDFHVPITLIHLHLIKHVLNLFSLHPQGIKSSKSHFCYRTQSHIFLNHLFLFNYLMHWRLFKRLGKVFFYYYENNCKSISLFLLYF